MNEITKASNEQIIRKIEDIIDIQKAKGSIGGKQVAFNLPSETTSTVSVSLARSLESGLPRAEGSNGLFSKKHKRLRSKRQKSPCPDLSWPSGSDVTVLRLKANLNNDIKKNITGILPGDGLHLPDSSSMVNLATLLQAPTSKHNVYTEEYLFPLSSWEHPQEEYSKLFSAGELNSTVGEPITHKPLPEFILPAHCSRDETDELGREVEKALTGSKISKFTKILKYFCSCCSWPFNEEKIRETPYMNTSNEESSDR